jgi:arylsulfatase A-like enzyme
VRQHRLPIVSRDAHFDVVSGIRRIGWGFRARRPPESTPARWILLANTRDVSHDPGQRMHMQPWLKIASLLVAAVMLSKPVGVVAAPAPASPNIVLMFIDDMGYADIGPFGANAYRTPHLDRLAAEGMRFTDFLVSSAVCSASRAALMTGCYHRRVGISGALGPKARHGLHPDEVTIAEICKQKGYATACFGKWHLGHHPKFLPTRQGFDEYYGLPYSNDMWPYHPGVRHLPMAERLQRWPHLPLIEGTEVVNPRVDPAAQQLLTRQYTERAVAFIERNRDRPFLLYLPHSMVHVPLHASDAFAGKSGAGLFGDVVMEIDWSMGRILDTLRELGLEDRTLVLFTSDNGPWLSYGDHAGSAKPLREGKGTAWEGGFRVPTLARWPGRIPAAATCDELASTIDILPTIAHLIGTALPDHPIDGRDIRPLLFGQPDARSPHDYFYYYYENGQLQAIRDRQWKLHLPHAYRTLDGRPGGTGGIPVAYQTARTGLALYDLKSDPGETTDLAAAQPDVVARLQRAADAARKDLGDTLTDTRGAGIRPAATLGPDDPVTPLVDQP